MEILNIAVVSSDEAYNKALCVSLVSACRQMEVTSFTSRQFVLEWASYQGNGAFYDQFDLILWAGDEISDSYGDNIIYLTDRASLVNMDYEGRKFCIYKYSPAGSLAALIFDIYSHLTGRKVPLVKRDQVGIFAFASYCGGTGLTTLARSVCQELTRFYGKRILYLSLEDVDSTCSFLKTPEGVKSEGEFLYRLLGREKMPFLEPYLVRDVFGVSSFAPPKGRNPLGELSKEDMQVLLSALMDSGLFDTLVADLSTCLTEASVAVMEPAERIIIVAGTTNPGMREQNYMKQLKGSLGQEAQRRIMRVENKVQGGNNDAAGIRVRKTPDGQEPDLSAPLEGEFGKDVSMLTAGLINMLQ